jgi:hypothetical protein
VGVEVWGQPDAFSPWDPPGPGDAAAAAAYGSATQAQIWEANPASPPGLATFTEPLARGGSLVLVAHAGPGRLAAVSAAERVTARFP